MRNINSVTRSLFKFSALVALGVTMTLSARAQAADATRASAELKGSGDHFRWR